MGEARAAPGVRDQFYMIMWAGLALNAGTVAEAPHASSPCNRYAHPLPASLTQIIATTICKLPRDGASEKRRR